MDILNMKSNLDSRSTALISASNSKQLLTRTMPVAKDEVVKEVAIACANEISKQNKRSANR